MRLPYQDPDARLLLLRSSHDTGHIENIPESSSVVCTDINMVSICLVISIILYLIILPLFVSFINMLVVFRSKGRFFKIINSPTKLIYTFSDYLHISTSPPSNVWGYMSSLSWEGRYFSFEFSDTTVLSNQHSFYKSILFLGWI